MFYERVKWIGRPGSHGVSYGFMCAKLRGHLVFRVQLPSYVYLIQF